MWQRKKWYDARYFKEKEDYKTRQKIEIIPISLTFLQCFGEKYFWC